MELLALTPLGDMFVIVLLDFMERIVKVVSHLIEVLVCFFFLFIDWKCPVSFINMNRKKYNACMSQ